MITTTKRIIMAAVLTAALIATASADRYDDLIAKWSDHGVTGYSSYTESMDLAWKVVPRLQALFYGYLLTGDKALIDKAAPAIDYWVNTTPRNDPDGEPGFLNGSGEAPGETFRMIGAITQFIYIVKSNPELSEHVAAANAHLAKMEAGMIKKWLDKYYIDDTVEPPAMSHYPGTATMIYPCYEIDNGCPAVNGSSSMKGMSAQHNKASDVGIAFMWLYLATNKPEYKTIVQELALNYKSKLFWMQGGRFYSWYYWDPCQGGDYSSGEVGMGPIKNSDRRWIEHRSGYGSINMEFVTECYRNGIVFCRTDIDRFVTTNRNIMFNPGGDWLLNDGSVPPSGQYGGCYGALCTYDETSTLANISYDHWNENYSGWGGLGLPYFVYTMKLAESEKNPTATFDWVGPLEATEVEGLDRGTIKVTFYNKVEPTSAADISNYKLSRGGVITGAVVSADRMSVTLTTEEQVADYDYKLTCYDVYDIYGNKTFAYGNSQPWLFTSSSLSAGTYDAIAEAARVDISVTPSPFRTQVSFRTSNLPDNNSSIIITDMNGREVSRLQTGSVTWDGKDNSGTSVTSGMYLYTVTGTGVSGSIIKID